MSVKNIVVQKYGGTSVGTTDKLKNVADRILATQAQGKKMVVIVSAMGDSTDDLIKLARAIDPNASGREYDALISTGEAVSASLMAMAIKARGFDAISLSGRQAGVFTEDIHLKARILDVKPERIREELKSGKVVIVTGFQGVNSLDDVTTIGRGGSDTSAVVIAAALKAERCEIYTDVDGVYTANPNLINDARKLPIVSYDEMLEMASLGAQVLHPRSVEGAKAYGIELHVKSSYNFNEGTIVKEVSKVEIKNPVTGVAYDENTAKISIQGLPDQPGIAGSLFKKLAASKVNVDMIVQSNQINHRNNIAFTVNDDDFAKAIEITENYAKEVKADRVVFDKNVSKVSIIGVGMVSSPGVAADMFLMLGKAGINIDLISTSEIKVSCILSKKDTHKAVKILHDGFELAKG
jgi:aspartate kinase